MWPDDPKLHRAALDLYGAVWPHVPPGIERARAMGADWFRVSTPFTVPESDGDRLLAHAGVITCRWTLDGQPLEVAAVHGVCVHPDHRGRGLCRRVMEEALDHIDRSGAVTTILWSEKVDLYRKFGFEPTPESVFVGPAPKPEPVRAFPLDLEDPDHQRRLQRALDHRAPVSKRLAAADAGEHFFIDLALWDEARQFLVALPDHDAVAVCEVEGPLMRLYDVLGPRIPSAGALVGAAETAFDTTVERLEVYFTPDHLLDLGCPLGLEPCPHPIEDILMVRGRPLEQPSMGPFALSPFTRT